MNNNAYLAMFYTIPFLPAIAGVLVLQTVNSTFHNKKQHHKKTIENIAIASMTMFLYTSSMQ